MIRLEGNRPNTHLAYTSKRRPYQSLAAAWGILIVSASLVAATPAVALAQTAAGTEIRAHVNVSYEGRDGSPYVAASDTLVMIVAQLAGVDIEPARSVTSDPGAVAVFSHTLVNVGNGPDSAIVSAVSNSGWLARSYIDADANGVVSAGDPELVGPLPMTAGEIVNLLVAVDIPADVTLRGNSDTVTLTASSTFAPSATDVITNTIDIRSVGVMVSLTESVDRTTATTGDLLTYSITYLANGSNPALGVEITNVIPLGTTYVSGTIEWNGTRLTDTTGDDAGEFEVQTNRIMVLVGDLNDGESGTVTFQVRVDG